MPCPWGNSLGLGPAELVNNFTRTSWSPSRTIPVPSGPLGQPDLPFGSIPLATAVSTLFQDGLPAKAGPSETQDPRNSLCVSLSAAHAVLTAALAVGPSGRHAEPHRRGLAQPLPGRCVSPTHVGEWGAEGEPLPEPSRGTGGTPLPPIIFFHMFHLFYRTCFFNCGSRTLLRKLHRVYVYEQFHRPGPEIGHYLCLRNTF